MINEILVDKLILASGSPRRKAILSGLANEIIILPQNVEEISIETQPQDIVVDLSIIKLNNLPLLYPDMPIVGGDTIVWMDGKQFGKPKGREDAIIMLSELSGKWHCVYSGFAISYRGRILTGYDVAKVKFKTLTNQDIERYIDMYQPFDKAGAYGLQDGQVAEYYIGDLNTVIGFPYQVFLPMFTELLK